MKTKLAILSLSVVSITLFSFTAKKNKVFTLQSNGNYKVEADNMSDEDIVYLLEKTQDYKGARIFRKTIVFNESVKDGAVKETVSVNEKATDTDDQPSDDTEKQLTNIIAKYNK